MKNWTEKYDAERALIDEAWAEIQQLLAKHATEFSAETWHSGYAYDLAKIRFDLQQTAKFLKNED